MLPPNAAGYLDELRRTLRQRQRPVGPQDFDRAIAAVAIGMGKTAALSGEEEGAVRDRINRHLHELVDQNAATPLENPFFFPVLQEHARIINDVARNELGLDTWVQSRLDAMPLLGTLPTGHIDAFTAEVPQSQETVIVLNEGIYGLIYLGIKAIVSALPAEVFLDGNVVPGRLSVDSIVDRVASAPEVRQRFLEFIEATVRTGHPFAAPQYLAASPWDAAIPKLVDAAELFVVAHEYAHVILGHLATNPTKAIMEGDEPNAPAVDCSILIRSWQEEYAADRMGAMLAVTAAARASEGNEGRAWATIQLYFALVDVVQRAISTLEYGVDRAPFQDSHPPSALRARVLSEHVNDIFTDKDGQRFVMALGSAFSIAAETLWMSTRDAVLDAHRRGERAAPVWRRLLLRPTIPMGDPATARLPRDDRQKLIVFFRGMLELEGEMKLEAARICVTGGNALALALVEELAYGDAGRVKEVSAMISRLGPNAPPQLPDVRRMFAAFGRYLPIVDLPIEEFLTALSTGIEAHAKAVLGPEPPSE